MTGHYIESKATIDLLANHCMDWNSVLYVGWHPLITTDGGDWYRSYIQQLRGCSSEHTIIERYKPYYDAMLAHPSNQGVRGLNVNIVEWAPVTTERFDLIIWWHGPEHVTATQMVQTVQALEHIGRYIILGGPEGPDVSYPVPEAGSEDSHKCVLTRKQFAELGYKTVSFNRSERGQGPHISAVKIL